MNGSVGPPGPIGPRVRHFSPSFLDPFFDIPWVGKFRVKHLLHKDVWHSFFVNLNTRGMFYVMELIHVKKIAFRDNRKKIRSMVISYALVGT